MPSPSSKPAELVLPGFRIRRCIGAGGMGEVFEAVEESLGRSVAIKRLRPDRMDAESPQFGTWQARFRREARLLAAVKHPNIAVVHAVIEHGGHLHMVMEYVEGHSLREVLKSGPMSVEDALEVCRQVAIGLAAAHDAGVIHRDIKPDNIRIGRDGLVKILDFGLARQIGPETGVDASASTLTSEATTVLGTRAGAFLGTAGYAAPEQVKGEVVDQRADVFGFGCVLYECLCGQRAFEGRGKWGAEVVLREEPSWGLLPAGLAATTRELLRACLSRNALSRPSEMAELREELDRVRVEALRRTATTAAPRSDEVATVVGLPAASTSFVGRTSETESLRSMLRSARLLTVTGLGGVGKSRLACYTARDLMERQLTGSSPSFDRAYFVRAASLQTPRQLLQAIARTLGVQGKPGSGLVSQIAVELGGHRVLAVIDSCEHFSAAQRALIAELIASCAGLVILATSRDRLGLDGEQVFALGPMECAVAPGHERGSGAGSALSVDASCAMGACGEGERLFIERAAAACPGFSALAPDLPIISAICRRVGSIPLGIELAAACTDVLSPAEILGRLSLSVDALAGASGGGSADRTIGSVVEWSVQRLDPRQQSGLRRLSVFAGDFSLAAAERLGDDCALDPAGDLAPGALSGPVGGPSITSGEMLGVLSTLIRKSLVVRRADRGGADARTRYFVLDPVREVVRALSNAEPGLERDRAAAIRRMVAWAVEACEFAERAVEEGRQQAAIEQLHSDYASVRGALAAAIDPAPSPSALRLVATLDKIWYRSRLVQEATEWIECVLEGPAIVDAPPMLLARAMKSAAVVAEMRAEPRGAIAWAERAVAVLRGVESPGVDELRARLLNNIGLACTGLAEPAAGRSAFESALAACRSAGDDRVASHVHLNWASLEIEFGDRTRAAQLLEVAIPVFERHKDDLRAGVAAYNLAELKFRGGDYPGAMSCVNQSFSSALASGDEAGLALNALAAAAIGIRVGASAAAAPLLEYALKRCGELSLPTTNFAEEDLRLDARGANGDACGDRALPSPDPSVLAGLRALAASIPRRISTGD